MGLLGNLTAAQIVEQVVAARRLVWEEAAASGATRHVTPCTNLVFMGMGAWGAWGSKGPGTREWGALGGARRLGGRWQRAPRGVGGPRCGR